MRLHEFNHRKELNEDPNAIGLLVGLGTGAIGAVAISYLVNRLTRDDLDDMYDGIHARFKKEKNLDKKNYLKKALIGIKKLLGSSKFKQEISQELTPLLAEIQTNCSEILGAYQKTNKVLYRGMSYNTSSIYMLNPRSDRRPMSSEKSAQELYDYASRKSGIEALRSNSVFTTSDVEQAANYGSVYIIFPKNEFKFSWTPGVEDVVIRNKNIMKDDVLLHLMNEFIKFTKQNNLSAKSIDTLFNTYGITKTNEYLRSIGFPLADLVTLDNLLDATKFKYYGLTNKNIIAAIGSGGEVLIKGECYALKISKYGQALTNAFNLRIYKDIDNDDIEDDL